MTQYGTADGAFTWNSKTLTPYITTQFPTVEETQETEDVTPLGGTITVQAFTKLMTYGEVTIGGQYDDTATTGPEVVIGGGCRARTLGTMVITWGGGKNTSITNVGIKSYRRIQAKGALTQFEATFFLAAGAAVTEN